MIPLTISPSLHWPRSLWCLSFVFLDHRLMRCDLFYYSYVKIVDMENLYKELGDQSLQKDFCQTVASTFRYFLLNYWTILIRNASIFSIIGGFIWLHFQLFLLMLLWVLSLFFSIIYVSKLFCESEWEIICNLETGASLFSSYNMVKCK